MPRKIQNTIAEAKPPPRIRVVCQREIADRDVPLKLPALLQLGCGESHGFYD